MAANAADRVANALRAELMNGTLKPGDRMREEELASRFEVGRYTVRAALAKLVSSRVLDHEPFRGACVPVITRERVDQLHDFRVVLEIGSLRLLREHGGTLRGIERATEALAALPDSAAWEDVTVAHNEIHRAIVAATGNERLQQAFAICEEELEFMLALVRPHVTVRTLARLHLDLLDGLRFGADKAELALRQDLANGYGAFIDALTQERDGTRSGGGGARDKED